MKMIGDEVHIQRGEIWSLDFAIENDKGHPFVILNNWQNPYLAITVASSLYEQYGDFRETYWLDLSKRYEEQSDGRMVLRALKTFTSAVPLYLPTDFTLEQVIKHYGDRLVLDPGNDFDVMKFLFFTDPQNDGNYVYKYVKSYTLDDNDNVDIEKWAEYDFRVIKQFNTKNWMEQGYWYDIKVLTGESVQERLRSVLRVQRITDIKSTTWTNEDWEKYLNMVEDETTRQELQQLYDEGIPLMPSYDIKGVLLEPTPIYVSANIQGGVR